MAIGLTYDQMIALNPCHIRRDAVIEVLGGAKAWNGRVVTAKEAVEAGISLDDLAWVAARVACTDTDVERRVRLWMADCAARHLHSYEKQAPGDCRVRDAIIAARQFARGEIDAAASAAASAAAWDAARAAAKAAARDAAWDAAWDAASAAARAAASAAAWDAARAAAWAAEEQWQFAPLVARLDDPEPDDWPLDATTEADN